MDKFGIKGKYYAYLRRNDNRFLFVKKLRAIKEFN